MLSANDLFTEVQHIYNETIEKNTYTNSKDNTRGPFNWVETFQKYSEIENWELNPMVNKVTKTKKAENPPKTKHHKTRFETNTRNLIFLNVPKGSDILKLFLYQLENDILNEALTL